GYCLSCVSRQSRLKRQVCQSHAENISNVLVKVVRVCHEVFLYLTLCTQMKCPRVRRPESRIDGNGRHVRSAANECHREIARLSPVKKTRCLPHRHTRGVHELFWR